MNGKHALRGRSRRRESMREIRQEAVESLHEGENPVARILGRPAADMSVLMIDERLSHDVEKIGADGVGEVYRAHEQDLGATWR